MRGRLAKAEPFKTFHSVAAGQCTCVQSYVSVSTIGRPPLAEHSRNASRAARRKSRLEPEIVQILKSRAELSRNCFEGGAHHKVKLPSRSSDSRRA